MNQTIMALEITRIQPERMRVIKEEEGLYSIQAYNTRIESWINLEQCYDETIALNKCINWYHKNRQ